MPAASEQSAATCANCGAALVADQRYCLTCGQPCSPVRLAFLDVLAAEQTRPPTPPPWGAAGTIDMSPAGHLPVIHGAQGGPGGWLRRNSGLMGLLSVLLMCLLAGLLVGHWVSQGKAPSQQTVKIEGLAGLAAAGAGATTGPSTAAAATTPAPAAKAKSKAKQEDKEAAEGEKETAAEKAPPAKPVQVAPAKLKKLSNTTGKKHQEEINALGNQPIETG